MNYRQDSLCLTREQKDDDSPCQQPVPKHRDELLLQRDLQDFHQADAEDPLVFSSHMSQQTQREQLCQLQLSTARLPLSRCAPLRLNTQR